MRLFDFIPFPALIALLIALVNVTVQVIKRVIKVDKPERVVVICAVALSVIAAVLAAVLQGWQLWYMIILAIVAGSLLGLLVAYAAMFGYDELYAQVLEMLLSLLPHREGE